MRSAVHTFGASKNRFGFAKSAGATWLVNTIVFLALAAIAVFLGAISSTGNILFFLAMVALILGFGVFSLPLQVITFGLFIAGFYVIGPVIYAFGFSQIQWVPALVSLMLAAKLFVLRFYASNTRTRSIGVSPITRLLTVFILICLVGALVGGISLGDFVNSSRWYLFFWPLMFVIGSDHFGEKNIRRLWQFLIVALFIQLPFSVYQFLFVARQSRRDITPWDSVVGTFPGGAESGGQSAAMGVFVLLMALFVFALWRAGKMRGVWMLGAWSTMLIYLALAEVKAVVLMVPVAVAFYYRRELLKRPIQSVALISGAIVFIFVAFSAYQKFYYDRYDTGHIGGPRTALSSIENAISPDNVGVYRPELGRVTHLVFWWKETAAKGDIAGALLGHGMGAVHVSRVAVGQIAARYPYPMDITSVVILLWEVGFIGLILFVLILLAGAVGSARLAKNALIDEWHRVALRVGSVGLVIIMLTLPYKDLALRATGVVMVEMLMLGQVLYWRKRAAQLHRISIESKI